MNTLLHIAIRDSDENKIKIILENSLKVDFNDINILHEAILPYEAAHNTINNTDQPEFQILFKEI